MMMLEVFVLVLVIVFSFLPGYSSDIAKKISKSLFSLTTEELNLRSQIKELKSEQDTISMTDEFAKYAKLQRRIDKILTQIKQFSSDRSRNVAMVSVGVKISIYVFHVLVMLSIILYNRNDPLITFPSEWVYPLHRFVALPTGIPGSLGITCWIIVCSATVYRLKKLLV